MCDFPEWFETWSVASGLMKMLICGAMLLASTLLLQMKPFSIPLYYAAAT